MAVPDKKKSSSSSPRKPSPSAGGGGPPPPADPMGGGGMSPLSSMLGGMGMGGGGMGMGMDPMSMMMGGGGGGMGMPLPPPPAPPPPAFPPGDGGMPVGGQMPPPDDGMDQGGGSPLLQQLMATLGGGGGGGMGQTVAGGLAPLSPSGITPELAGHDYNQPAAMQGHATDGTGTGDPRMGLQQLLAMLAFAQLGTQMPGVGASGVDMQPPNMGQGYI